jgi:hypothetical protein
MVIKHEKGINYETEKRSKSKSLGNNSRKKKVYIGTSTKNIKKYIY